MDIQKTSVKILAIFMIVVMCVFISVDLFYHPWTTWDYVQVATLSIITVIFAVRIFTGDKSNE